MQRTKRVDQHFGSLQLPGIAVTVKREGLDDVRVGCHADGRVHRGRGIERNNYCRDILPKVELRKLALVLRGSRAGEDEMDDAASQITKGDGRAVRGRPSDQIRIPAWQCLLNVADFQSAAPCRRAIALPPRAP